MIQEWRHIQGQVMFQRRSHENYLRCWTQRKYPLEELLKSTPLEYVNSWRRSWLRHSLVFDVLCQKDPIRIHQTSNRPGLGPQRFNLIDPPRMDVNITKMMSTWGLNEVPFFQWQSTEWTKLLRTPSHRSEMSPWGFPPNSALVEVICVGAPIWVGRICEQLYCWRRRKSGKVRLKHSCLEPKKLCSKI